MEETFPLSGTSDPAPPRRRLGTRVFLGLALAFLALLVWRSLANRAATSQDRFTAAHEAAEERKAAFQEVLPGGHLPPPFVLHGHAEAGELRLVWMVRSFDGAQALLVAAPQAPREEEIAEAAGRLRAPFLPARQILDEPGVQVDKRPPFQEEFRQREAWDHAAPPLTFWTGSWDEILDELRASGRGGGEGILLEAGPQRSFPMSRPRKAEGVWWVAVDLSSAAPSGRLFLVHLLPAAERPPAAEIHDFLERLLPEAS